MIPKKIHYIWFGGKPLPDDAKKCIESWKKYCPDYEIIEWNESNYDLEKNEYVKKAYEQKKYAFLADYVRLDVIYEHGGIYLDTDVELIKNLDDLLEYDGYIGMEEVGTINTGQGFGAKKHHPFVKENKEYYENNKFWDEDGNFQKVICVEITTKLLKEHGLKEKNQKQDVAGMKIFPIEYFCPIVMGTNQLKVTKNTYSIHHFAASWKSDNKLIRKLSYYSIPIKREIKKIINNKIIPIENNEFKIILVSMFIGSIIWPFTYLALFISLFMAAILGFKMTKQTSSKYCKGIISLLLYQNLCIGLGAHLFGNFSSSLKIITQIPFATLFVIWAIQFIKNPKIRQDKSFKFFIALLICIAISFLIGRGSILAILINIRNLITFFIAYQIGKLNIENTEDLNDVVKHIIKNAVIFLVFGIILNILGYKGYQLIGIDEVYHAKGVEITGKLDGRFHTTLIKTQFLRMGSLMYEPVNLAYFYSLATIVAFFTTWTKDIKKKLLLTILCGVGLILTFGKGGYLLTFTAFLSYYLYKILEKYVSPKMKFNAKKTFIGSLILIAIFFISFCLFYYWNIGAAANVHFWAIEATWKSVISRPLGYGLGTGGNMATLFNNTPIETWLSSGGETALMSFTYQLGLQGLICIIICMISMIRIKQKNQKPLQIVFNYIPFLILGVALLQDNTFTPQCIVPFMFIQGACTRLSSREDK